MDNNEGVSAYVTRLQALTNHKKNCSEVLTDQVIVEEILRTVSPKFDHIVVAKLKNQKI